MTLTAAQKASLWRKGILAWKLRGRIQRDLYKFLVKTESKLLTAAVIHRQCGKTTTLVIYAFEKALRTPRTRILFISPQRSDLRKYVGAIVAELLQDCPEDTRPSFTSDGQLVFPNGSVVMLEGADRENYQKLRGRSSHLTIVDEGGFHQYFEALVYSILIPQTLKTGGRIVGISTWPESPAHAFVAFARQCEEDDAFILRSIDENETVTPEVKERMLRAFPGGESSTRWRREMRCELVMEEDSAIFPEVALAIDHIVKPVPSPKYENRVVGMDVGFHPDYTGVLFGYYDFKRGIWCVEDELLKNKMRTDQLASWVAEKEKERWGETKPKVRVSDTAKILLNDLANLHDLIFNEVGKTNLDAMVNEVRILLHEHRIEIHPRCTNLIFQLKTGFWNSARTEFARTVEGGHFDLLAALIYFVRGGNSITHINPYPAIPEDFNPDTAIWLAEEEKAPEVEAFEQLFIR